MPAILVFALLCSCNGNLDYDTSKGINTEMTLFQEEISVPIGSIGPLTIGSALDRLNTVPGIGSMVSQLIQVGEDGYLRMDDKGSILRITAAMSNGFGGTMAYSSLPLKANNKVATIGLTYDL